MHNWIYYNGATVDDNEESTMVMTVDVEDGSFAEENNEEKIDAVNVGEDGGTANTKVGYTNTANGDVLAPPPHDYFPVGFTFFMICGPVAEKNFHVTSLCLDDMINFMSSGKGRASHRAKQAQDKSALRDYNNGTATDPCQQRGISFGGSQLEIASVAQNQARITNKEFQGDLVKHDLLMTSKRERIKSELEMAKLLVSMGDQDEAKNHMKKSKHFMVEVKSIEDSLQEMKKRKTQTAGFDVEEYLKRG